MKVPIARFAVRNAGGADDGLLIGSVFKSARESFKPGHVYELQAWDMFMSEIMGVDNAVDLVDVGESCIPRDNQSRQADHIGPCSWSSSVGAILDTAGPYVVLTRKEYEALCRR